jgi:hypothetical protein
MAKAYRWAYMANPNYITSSNDCPVCETPSKVYEIGARTENDVLIVTWKCEHLHEWTIETRKVEVKV